MTTADALYRVLAVSCGGTGLVGLALSRQAPRVGLWRGVGFALTALALGAWAARWIEAGHLPLFGTYESGLSLVVAVLAAALFVERRTGHVQGLVTGAGFVSAGLLAHALRYDPTAYALTISERSWLVDLHSFVAWGAFGVLAANAALSAAEFGRPAAEQSSGRWLGWTLEVGFFLHTAMMATGSAYRFLLFGTAWAFDPIELLGFVAWMAYGTLLHLHLFARWKGRRLGAWSLGLFVLLVVSYRFIVYFPSWATYHIFDVALREHIVR